MSNLLEPLRANTGLMIAVILPLACAFVLTAVGTLMYAGGASLKPVVFLGVFMALVISPQIVGQMVMAVVPGQRTGSAAAPDLAWTSSMQDARDALASVTPNAEWVRVAVNPQGATTWVALFPNVEDARRAAAVYSQAYQLYGTSGSPESGWQARSRFNQTFVELLVTGRVLYVWTGLTREAAAAVRAATPVPAMAEAAPLFPSLQFLREWFEPWWVKALSLSLLLVLCVIWFVLGTAWANVAPANWILVLRTS